MKVPYLKVSIFVFNCKITKKFCKRAEDSFKIVGFYQ